MQELLSNVYFWSALALLVLLVIAFRFGRAPVTNWLDGEIGKIREALKQAEALRAEAAATLANYQKKQAEAEAEAAAIVAQAEREAERLRQQAETELQASLTRREQQAMERIALAEAEAIAEVRTAAVDLAMATVTKALHERLGAAEAGQLIDQAIAELPQKLQRGKAA